MSLEKTIAAFAAEHDNWSIQGEQLIGMFSFETFSQVQPFVEAIMNESEEQNHHPVVTFGYKTVRIELVTHEVGNVLTKKDLLLARSIQQLSGSE